MNTDRKKISSVESHQGRRFQKRIEEYQSGSWNEIELTRFLYDDWNLIAKYDATNGSNDLDKTYVWGLDLSLSPQGAGGVGGLLSMTEETASETYFYAFDANGNVTQLIDDSGSLAAHYEYSPFGQLVASNGPMADINPFRFSTKYQDETTGLLYYGFRYYDPETGRWLSRDPLGEQGGVNMYGFNQENPVNHIDILGLKIIARPVRPIIPPTNPPSGNGNECDPEDKQTQVKTVDCETPCSYKSIWDFFCKDCSDKEGQGKREQDYICEKKSSNGHLGKVWKWVKDGDPFYYGCDAEDCSAGCEQHAYEYND